MTHERLVSGDGSRRGRGGGVELEDLATNGTHFTASRLLLLLLEKDLWRCCRRRSKKSASTRRGAATATSASIGRLDHAAVVGQELIGLVDLDAHALALALAHLLVHDGHMGLQVAHPPKLALAHDAQIFLAHHCQVRRRYSTTATNSNQTNRGR